MYYYNIQHHNPFKDAEARKELNKYHQENCTWPEDSAASAKSLQW